MFRVYEPAFDKRDAISAAARRVVTDGQLHKAYWHAGAKAGDKNFCWIASTARKVLSDVLCVIAERIGPQHLAHPLPRSGIGGIDWTNEMREGHFAKLYRTSPGPVNRTDA